MATGARPANAGAITRTLKAAGLTHGEEHKASRGVVRGGWSTFTTGYVTVAYQFGRAMDSTGPERAARAERDLTHAAEILRGKGFEVTVNAAVSEYGTVSLSVCRKDDDGKVVAF